jgi:hypothetical protein
MRRRSYGLVRSNTSRFRSLPPPIVILSLNVFEGMNFAFAPLNSVIFCMFAFVFS